jgi:hypothetical protein
MTARYGAFVRWPDVPLWLALGWLCTGELPGQHGEWSAGMAWLCDCEVRKP